MFLSSTGVSIILSLPFFVFLVHSFPSVDYLILKKKKGKNHSNIDSYKLGSLSRGFGWDVTWEKVEEALQEPEDTNGGNGIDRN